MKIQVVECEDGDMDRAFEIVSEAFGHEHPYVEALFPDHALPEGRVAGGKRLLAIKHADPYTTFLKATDETGKMVGVAKWNIYHGNVPEETDVDGNFWKTAEEKEIAQILYREYLKLRREAIRNSNGNLVVLDILTIDPKHQRQGAGRALVKWGTGQADQLGVKVVVEASDYGRGLYASEGFEYDQLYTTTYPEKYAGREGQSFHWMIRPAQGNGH